MERVVDAGRSPEVFENDIAYFLKVFCEEQGIEDMAKESQSRWSAALIYIRRNVFPTTDALKSNKKVLTDNSIMPSTHWAYDYDLVDNILDYYIYMCLMYDKEITTIGFGLMTGITNDTFDRWRNNRVKLSSKTKTIMEKLKDYREYSLSNKLATGNKNPVGVLAILNRFYQWNLPGVSRETQKIVARTPEEIAQSYGELCENDKQLDLPDVPD